MGVIEIFIGFATGLFVNATTSQLSKLLPNETQKTLERACHEWADQIDGDQNGASIMDTFFVYGDSVEYQSQDQYEHRLLEPNWKLS